MAQISNSQYKQIPPLEKHKNHTVSIVPVSAGPHAAKMHCTKCKKFVAWAKLSDLHYYEDVIKKPKVLQDLLSKLRS